MSRAGWWGAIALAALVGSGVGSAAADPTACLPVAGGGALTVEGVGRVVFAELATDRVRDAATFGGRVCLAIEGSDVVFRTERLEAVGLAGTLTLEATGVRVDVPGWTLQATALRGGPEWAELTEVAIAGIDAVGLADTMRLEFATGVLVATGLQLLTPSLRLDAETASLNGEALVAEGARVSSCECAPEDAPLRVDATRVTLDLGPAVAAVVEGGMVVTGGVRWLLPDPIALDAASLADLVLPVAIGPDPDRRGAWRVAVLARQVAPGVRLETAWTSGTAEGAARGGFEVTAEAGGATLVWAGGSDHLAVDVRAGTALGDGWRVAARQRFEAGASVDPVRDAAVRLSHAASDAGAWGRWSTEVGALTALTGQTLGGADVAAPRLGIDGRFAWTAPIVPIVPGLDVAGATTTYPGLGATQTWASVRPSLAVRAANVRVDAAHVARWVVGRSPFSARVDRVAAEQRSDVAASWGTAVAANVRVDLGGAVRYRWDLDPLRPGLRLGFEDLTLRAGATLPAGAGSVRLDVAVALAGHVDPRPGRDAFASVQLGWTLDRWEAGVRTTVGLEPGGAWRDLTVFAAVPFDASPSWSWRPYLAVDVLAFAGGEGPWLRGHGLDVAWRTCCGTVELGYRSDAADGATTHFALILPVRPLDPALLATRPGAR